MSSFLNITLPQIFIVPVRSKQRTVATGISRVLVFQLLCLLRVHKDWPTTFLRMWVVLSTLQEWYLCDAIAALFHDFLIMR